MKKFKAEITLEGSYANAGWLEEQLKTLVDDVEGGGTITLSDPVVREFRERAPRPSKKKPMQTTIAGE